MDGQFVGFLITVQNFRQFALVHAYLMPLPNLHIADICKLGKAIIKHAKG
jgi:hypothetical protein